MKELNRVLENLECFSRSMGNPITLVEASAYIRRLSAATPEPDANLLSSRLRPNIECAPWVIESVKRLEQLLAASAQQGGGPALPVEIRGWMEHCVSAADEGEDYACPRSVLDALTTFGLMEKCGRGKWRPTDKGAALVYTAPATRAEGVDAAASKLYRDSLPKETPIHSNRCERAWIELTESERNYWRVKAALADAQGSK